MGSVKSVAVANREESLSTNQGDGEDSKTLIKDERDVEESKTLTEDLNETEEEEECSLCRYIKGGECKDEFIALQRCTDESEIHGQGSDVTKCKEIRVKFKTCMYDNAVYYEPILAGEARVIAKMLMEFHRKNEAILAAGEAADIAKAVTKLQTEEAPVLPAEAAAIAKPFQELLADKKDKEEAERSKRNKAEKKEEEADSSKGNESDDHNQN